VIGLSLDDVRPKPTKLDDVHPKPTRLEDVRPKPTRQPKQILGSR